MKPFSAWPVWNAALRTFEQEFKEPLARPQGLEFLRARGLREWNLWMQDLRGRSLRKVLTQELKGELERVLPWPENSYRDLLLSGYLREKTVAGETVGCESIAQPLVSVVVPVYGKVELTIRCLLSLGAASEKSSFEVLLIDDCSPDETEATLKNCPGIRYLRNDKNLGFIGSCNRGAEHARGKYLHFLNNDTVVLPGWLDGLVKTLEKTQGAGMIGSRLIYPSLDLQEAGGVVWKDGTATNFGNGRDPFNPAYNYLRDVDYCSAASVLLERELFHAIGGFDERYKPAYYEDTDLAFKVRQAGKRVLYQPSSRVIHYEGATSGTDTSSGTKRYQEINRHTFREKWSDLLETHGYHGDVSAAELDRFSERSVLVLDTKTPMPDQDSGSVDMINMLQIFRDLRCRVTFLPVAFFPPVPGAPNVKNRSAGYTEALEAMGVEVCYSPYEYSVERFLRERGAEFDVVMLTRARVADRFLSSVRAFCPNAKLVFNTTDLSFVREEREAKLRKSKLLALKAIDTRRRELGAIQRSDATIVLSQSEVELIGGLLPRSRLHVIPLLREITGGKASFAARKDLLFVGGFRHRPNLDAVEFLLQSIWPIVSAALPDARMHIVGSDTPASLHAMASERVILHGQVPDLTPLFESCRLSVAPLRFGAGLKGKVAQSLSLGVPCVSTSMGVEGSGLRHEETVLVADEAKDFAEAVVRVYTDEELWNRLSVNGLEFVRGMYSLEANKPRVAKLLEELAALP